MQQGDTGDRPMGNERPPGVREPAEPAGGPGRPPVQPPNRPGYQQQQYRRRVPRQPKGTGGMEPETVTTILGAIVALGAVVVFISTFLPWFKVGGVSDTGVQLMTLEGEGFFMIKWGWGGILFTGFFSLLIGTLMIIPVIALFLNKRSGASWSIVTGVFGFFISLVNIIMVYSTYENGGVGVGLWLMLVFSIAVLVCGSIGIRYS